MNNKISNKYPNQTIINCKTTSIKLELGVKKAQKQQFLPSCMEFTNEVDQILSGRSLNLSSSPLKDCSNTPQYQPYQSKSNSPQPTLSHAEIERQLLKNETVTSYLKSNTVHINEFGVPVYTQAERRVYDFISEYIAFRNPSFSRETGNFEFFSPRASDNFMDFDCEAYDQLATKMGATGRYPRLNIPAYNAFNFFGTKFCDVNDIMKKNLEKINEYKKHSDNLLGIHYLGHTVLPQTIPSLIRAINYNAINLDDTSSNIAIFNLLYQGHYTACLFVIDSTDRDNPFVTDLFMFDSSEGDYGKEIRPNFKDVIKHPGIYMTYVGYGAQINKPWDGYDIDNDCAFYAIRAMNALVKILAFSKDSPLASRILQGKPNANSIDFSSYKNCLAQEMPEYFDYNPTTNRYYPKSRQQRRITNIGDRWYLGKISIKKEIAKLSKSA